MDTLIRVWFGTMFIGITLCCIVCFGGMLWCLLRPLIRQFKKNKMDFRKKLAEFGYNRGNSVDVEILIDEILPSLFSQQEIMYSEEDFKLFVRQFYRDIKLDNSNLLWEELADKCFEQFKKKQSC